MSMTVAPARERGLKSVGTSFKVIALSRSREGAWIEIAFMTTAMLMTGSLPRGSVD